MQATFKLLRIRNTTKSYIPTLTPIYYLSVVDPHAAWYGKWMISQLGRAQVVNSMQRYHALEFFVENFVIFVSSELFRLKADNCSSDELKVEDFDDNELMVINGSDLEYLHFLHLIVFISKMISCTAGRKCFPIKLDESKFTNDIKKILGFCNCFSF
jgi:hypothetical protein